MQNTSDSLFRELEQLEAIHSTLSENLAQAAEQFRQSRIAPPAELVAELANYEKRFDELARRILERGKALSLSAGQLSNLSASSLDDVKRSLQSIAEIEDKNAKMAIKVKAVATLDRALCLVRRDRAVSPPISKFQAMAQAIRETIVNSAALELPPEARELAGGKHAISRLLDLIEHQEDFTDDECLNLHETIAESLGKELAVAALRGKLEAPSSAGVSAEQTQPKPSPEASAQSDSSVAELSLRRGASKREESASSRFLPVAQPDLDAAVEKLLEQHFQEASRQTDLDLTMPGEPRGGAAGTPGAQAASGTKQEAETPAAEPPAEEPSALQTAFEVGNSVMEAIRVEEIADRCLAEDKLSEAEANYQQLLILQKKLFDTKDPKVVRTTQNLATVERLLRRRGAEDKLKNEALKSDGGHQQPVLLASFQPMLEEGSSRRIGVTSAVVLAIGISLYAAIRYWPAAAEQAVAPPSVNVSGASQPPPIPASAEPSRVPDEPKPPEALAPPPAAQLPIQRTDQRATQPEIQSVDKPGVVPKRELITSAPSQRTSASRSPIQKPPPVHLNPLQANPVRPKPAPSQAVVREEPGVPALPNATVGGPAAGAAGSALSGLTPPDTSLPPPPAGPLQRVRAGGLVAAPKLISKTTPVYPNVAKESRVQGTVRLGAIIDKDGSIANLTVISGPSLLIKPAMDAVKEWRYQPTILDGNPVEVETTVDVNFALNP